MPIFRSLRQSNSGLSRPFRRYFMAGEVDLMGWYRGCHACLTYRVCVPNIDDSSLFSSVVPDFLLFWICGVFRKRTIQICFEVHQSSTSGSCVPIYRSFRDLGRVYTCSPPHWLRRVFRSWILKTALRCAIKSLLLETVYKFQVLWTFNGDTPDAPLAGFYRWRGRYREEVRRMWSRSNLWRLRAELRQYSPSLSAVLDKNW